MITAQKGMQENVLKSEADFILIGTGRGSGVTTAMLLHAKSHDINASFTNTNKYIKVAAERIFDRPFYPDEESTCVTCNDRAITMIKDHWVIDSAGWVYMEHSYMYPEIKIVEVLDKDYNKAIVSLVPDKDSWASEWYNKKGYFYVYGSSMRDVIWGETKMEIFNKMEALITHKKHTIDNIRSFEYISASLGENKALLESDPSYLSNISAGSDEDRKKSLGGSWE